MSAIMRGVHQVSHCGECELNHLNLETCFHINGCPVIGEIPDKHGKLIDANELKRKLIKYGFKAPDMTVEEFVDDELTTILDEENTGGGFVSYEQRQ